MQTTKTTNLEQKTSNGAGKTQEVVPKLVRKVKSADDKLVAFVVERPVVALGAALFVGYFVGRVFTRL